MFMFRNLILRRLGIITWGLRDSKLLKLFIPGNINVYNFNLIIISNVRVSLQDQLVNDVILSLSSYVDCIISLTYDEVLKLSNSISIYYHCWWLGVYPCRKFYGITLISPSLFILKNNSQYKCNLWQLISYYYNV